jgi:hypothetical protein
MEMIIKYDQFDWKEIPGIIGYFVSPRGEIGRQIDSTTYKILKPKRTPAGYQEYNVMTVDGKRITKTMHSLIALTFIGPRPKNYVINHKNGIKTDNRVENIEYVTRSENVLHAYRIGLMKAMKGEQAVNSKLTEDIVKIIKECKSVSVKKLAGIFNVDANTIRGIKAGTSWKHVQPQ